MDMPPSPSNAPPTSWPEWLAARETAPVAVLGHSLGTMIGLRLASHPRLQLTPALPSHSPLHSLICVGGLPAVTPASHKRLSERAALIRNQGMAGLAWRVAEGNFSKTTLSQRPEIAALFGSLWESQSAETYLEGLDSLLAADTGPFIAQVDAALPGAPRRRGRICARRGIPPLRRDPAGPMRFVELEGCAHMAFLEAPEAFAAAIADFLIQP